MSLPGEDTAAKTLWGEARSEPHEERTAIAWVLRNRLESGRWGNTLETVCKSPWQFSCWNQKDPNRTQMETLPIDDALYLECLLIVREVMKADKSADRTRGSCHYFAPPRWALNHEPVYKGRHWFYNTIA